MRILLALLFLLLSYSLAEAADEKFVIKVISGDTIVVDGGQIVRLAGVQSPSPEEPFGKEAKLFTTSQLLGRDVQLVVDGGNSTIGHKDVYGRTIAYVYRSSDSFFINAVLIQQGHGFLLTKYAQKMASRFQTLQLEARRAKKGVWQQTDVSPEEKAAADKEEFKDPPFENRPEYANPDIRVEIIWAKRADPRSRIARTTEEAKFLQQLYTDDAVGKGEVFILVKLRQNLAKALTENFQKNGIKLNVETEGKESEILKFSAEGMDQSDADKFCSIPFNRELFSGLEFVEVIFTDGSSFSYTYKVDR
ncbi:MAG: thermonuclease family protein [Blastocatellia bacterium]|nr:thermonuclease family protein [Blastocatellia bacterium]